MSEIQSFWWESQAAACEDIILSVDGLSALENDHNNQIIEIYSDCQKKREEIKQENNNRESLYSNDEIQKPKDDSPEPKPKNYSPKMYADSVDTNSNMQLIIETINTPQMEKFIDELIHAHIVWIQYYNQWRKKISSDNIDTIKTNLKTLIIATIETESDWRAHVSNSQWSSALWLGQILWGNWKYKIDSKWNRYYATSSLETFINNIIRSWIELDFLPNKIISQPSEIQATDFNVTQQIQIIMASIISHHKQNIWDNGIKRGIQEYLWLAFNEWNTWAMQKIYFDFWHTKVNWVTKDRFTRKLNKYLAKNV